MGGGAAMRAATKVAGLGLQSTGVRGGLPENFAARKAVRAPASVLSSASSVDDTRKLEIAAASQTGSAIAWELDDWEFDGYGLEEKPRLIFGPAPSIEETKEATSDLRDVIDRMNLSPSDSTGSPGSLSAVDEHSVASNVDSSNADTKTSVASQTSVPSVPNQALRAFKLLKENPAAQSVVASIAADPNVWNAVMQNESIKEYLQSEKKCMKSDEQDPLKEFEDSSEPGDAGKPGNLFTDFVENVKLAAVGWVNNLPGFFQDLFGGADVKTTSGPSNWSPSSTLVGGSIFGLAVMVIMVVVLKRG